jgi:hypothetical protein
MTAVQSPQQLIDATAAAKGIPLPVQPHWPWSTPDVLAILAARDAEWIEHLRRSGARSIAPRENATDF